MAENTARALAGGGKLYYVATMIPWDNEDHACIKRHIEARAGCGFITIERGRDILSCLRDTDNSGTYLVDSATALLANEMFSEGENADMLAYERVGSELMAFAAEVKNAVFVSDYIYSDAECFDSLTEAYRRGLAKIDRTLAFLCDTVVEVCVRNNVIHKGALPI